MNSFLAVKANMLEMLKYSQIEFSEYEKTKNEVKLQQSGEKLFNVFCRYLEIRYKTTTNTHNEIRYLANADSRNRNLLDRLELLHEYFYHSTKFEADQAALRYRELLKQVKQRVERL